MKNSVNGSNGATLYIRYFIRSNLLKVILYDNTKKILFSGKLRSISAHETERGDIKRLAQKIVSTILEKDIKGIRVYINGRNNCKNTILQIIQQNKIEVLFEKDVTYIFLNEALVPKKYRTK